MIAYEMAWLLQASRVVAPHRDPEVSFDSHPVDFAEQNPLDLGVKVVDCGAVGIESRLLLETWRLVRRNQVIVLLRETTHVMRE